MREHEVIATSIAWTFGTAMTRFELEERLLLGTTCMMPYLPNFSKSSIA